MMVDWYIFKGQIKINDSSVELYALFLSRSLTSATFASYVLVFCSVLAAIRRGQRVRGVVEEGTKAVRAVVIKWIARSDIFDSSFIQERGTEASPMHQGRRAGDRGG